MEHIHGITFTDYAATCAFLAQGKDITELLPTLGVEAPQWDQANAHWQNAMANDADFKLITLFGEVFQNPAQGKYAGAATQTTAGALEKIASMERYIEVGEHMSVASAYGVNAQTLLAEYGLTVMDWSQAGMHWGQELHKKMADPQADPQFYTWHTDTHERYRLQFEARYAAEAGPKLGDDIAF